MFGGRRNTDFCSLLERNSINIVFADDGYRSCLTAGKLIKLEHVINVFPGRLLLSVQPFLSFASLLHTCYCSNVQIQLRLLLMAQFLRGFLIKIPHWLMHHKADAGVGLSVDLHGVRIIHIMRETQHLFLCYSSFINQ